MPRFFLVRFLLISALAFNTSLFRPVFAEESSIVKDTEEAAENVAESVKEVVDERMYLDLFGEWSLTSSVFIV